MPSDDYLYLIAHSLTVIDLYRKGFKVLLHASFTFQIQVLHLKNAYHYLISTTLDNVSANIYLYVA